jgi:hypothetical protein
MIARSSVRQLREVWANVNPNGYSAERLDQGPHSASTSAGKFKYARAYEPVAACAFCRQFFPVETYLETCPWNGLCEMETQLNKEEQSTQKQQRRDDAMSNAQLGDKGVKALRRVPSAVVKHVADNDPPANRRRTEFSSGDKGKSGDTATDGNSAGIDEGGFKDVKAEPVYVDFDFSELFAHDTILQAASREKIANATQEKRTQKQHNVQAQRNHSLNLFEEEVQHLLVRIDKLESEFASKAVSRVSDRHVEQCAVNGSEQTRTAHAVVGIDGIQHNSKSSRVMRFVKGRSKRPRCKSRNKSRNKNKNKANKSAITSPKHTSRPQRAPGHARVQQRSCQGSFTWRGVKSALDDIGCLVSWFG